MIKRYLYLPFIFVFFSACSGLSNQVIEQPVIDDNIIKTNANAVLTANAEINSNCHFNITSHHGIVLVTGEAPTKELLNKIIAEIRIIPDIKLIHNELAIMRPSSAAMRTRDALISINLKSKLEHIAGFNSTRVKVVTERGTIFLLGALTKNEAYMITEIARRESGVKKVVKVFEYID